MEDGSLGPPFAYLGVHVDDILLIGGEKVRKELQELLSAAFPVEDWETNNFEYIGSHISVEADRVTVTQSMYTETRLFTVDILPGQEDGDEATEDQKADGQSLVGALGWLANQSRPDLQVGVSMAQQVQKDPLVGDIKFVNQLARKAEEHKSEGVVLYPIKKDRVAFLAYHDAGWANSPQDPEDPHYALTKDEDLSGQVHSGPPGLTHKKLKKQNSKIASQLGSILFMADSSVLDGSPAKLSLLDWKSHACQRVCRSTFAAESMACADALEGAQYMRAFYETLVRGGLKKVSECEHEIHLFTDCKSLYDTVTKEGLPRMPSDRRLAIDLAALRMDLDVEKGHRTQIHWVPTTVQEADMLTKPMKTEVWWRELKEPKLLPLRKLREDFISVNQEVDRRSVGI
jgi:hypothetical protein